MVRDVVQCLELLVITENTHSTEGVKISLGIEIKIDCVTLVVYLEGLSSESSGLVFRLDISFSI